MFKLLRILDSEGVYFLTGGQMDRLLRHIEKNPAKLKSCLTTRELDDGRYEVWVGNSQKKLVKPEYVAIMSERGIDVPSLLIKDWGPGRVYYKRVSLNEFHIYRSYVPTYLTANISPKGKLNITRYIFRVMGHRFAGVKFSISCDSTNNHLIVKRIL